jgi:hypothetical protein
LPISARCCPLPRMKALRDPQHLLASGLAAIRTQFQVPEGFAPPLLAAADAAAARRPTEHADWTDRPFVTLDPASSTDLDQAFTIEQRRRRRLLLHYAIADVAWFVARWRSARWRSLEARYDHLSARRQGQPLSARAQREGGKPAAGRPAAGGGADLTRRARWRGEARRRRARADREPRQAGLRERAGR